MEYLAGGSLADRLTREGAQPLGRTLEWLRQAASALDAAHASGIVHRDVKPANLLLDDDDGLKVADFGVASAAHLASFTEAGTVVGTAGYLAPEQARGETATPASDRYALAVVAFELLTGTRPFERESTTSEAMAHVSAPIPPASALNPELPAEVDDVLARGLAKQPEHRFSVVRRLRPRSSRRTRPGCGDDIRRCRRCRRACAAAPSPSPRRARGTRSAAARRGSRGCPSGARRRRARDGRETVKETVTLEGTTIVETVTTAPAPTTAPTTATTAPEPAGESPSQLNDRGFALMQAGDYAGALPLLEQAVAGLAGSGETAEAYASYNLAFTRLTLGSCDGVLDLLDRSEQVQGKRKEITRLRKEAREELRRGRLGAGREAGGVLLLVVLAVLA